MTGTIAALFVDPTGPYAAMPGVDPWDEARDARCYRGPHPVVAHPPCAAWGAYSKPHLGSTARGPLRGADGGCFLAALSSVAWWGGVLEHPRGSYAWAAHALRAPTPGGGWTRARGPEVGLWTCEVDQGHYGHAARKPTWLLWCGVGTPPELTWGASDPAPIGTGARRGNLESMSKRQRRLTPGPFAALLVELARAAAGPLK